MTTHRMRIPDRIVAGHPQASASPTGHTAAELHRLTKLVRAVGAHRIFIGYGRQCRSIAAAAAFNAAWTELGGTVEQIVNWPADAASWLRPARRLVAGDPDAWVIADTPAGWAQMAARLTAYPRWSPTRTFGFAALSDPVLVDLAGDALTGMTGATVGGGRWHITGRTLIVDYGPEPSRDDAVLTPPT